MATTQSDILAWIKRGQAQGATHLIVVCDTFDHDDYPVFVNSREEAEACVKDHRDGKHSMQKVMEVYFLNGNIHEQLNKPRSFTYL